MYSNQYGRPAPSSYGSAYYDAYLNPKFTKDMTPFSNENRYPVRREAKKEESESDRSESKEGLLK